MAPPVECSGNARRLRQRRVGHCMVLCVRLSNHNTLEYSAPSALPLVTLSAVAGCARMVVCLIWIIYAGVHQSRAGQRPGHAPSPGVPRRRLLTASGGRTTVEGRGRSSRGRADVAHWLPPIHYAAARRQAFVFLAATTKGGGDIGRKASAGASKRPRRRRWQQNLIRSLASSPRNSHFLGAVTSLRRARSSSGSKPIFGN